MWQSSLEVWVAGLGRQVEKSLFDIIRHLCTIACHVAQAASQSSHARRAPTASCTSHHGSHEGDEGRWNDMLEEVCCREPSRAEKKMS